jgi:hypothetical protein
MSEYQYSGWWWYHAGQPDARRLSTNDQVGLLDEQEQAVWLPLYAWAHRGGRDFLALNGYLAEYAETPAPWGRLPPEIGIGPDGIQAALRAAAPEPAPEPDPRTPEEILAAERLGMRCRRLWCRLVLVDAGLWAPLEAWAADPARSEIERAYWADAQIWRRTDPLVSAVGPALGLTDAQLDALFRAAIALEAANGTA